MKLTNYFFSAIFIHTFTQQVFLKAPSQAWHLHQCSRQSHIPSPRGFPSGAWGRNEKLIRQSEIGWEALGGMYETESGDEAGQGEKGEQDWDFK